MLLTWVSNFGYGFLLQKYDRIFFMIHSVVFLWMKGVFYGDLEIYYIGRKGVCLGDTDSVKGFTKFTKACKSSIVNLRLF